MTTNYSKSFNSYESAHSFMVFKNKSYLNIPKKESFAVVPSSSNGFAVVDLRTAIELGIGYVFSNGGYTKNPF